MKSIENKIINVLKSKPMTFLALAKFLFWDRRRNFILSGILSEMMTNSKIFLSSDKKYFVPNYIKKENGKLSLNAHGYGFVDTGEESFFIPPQNVNTSMSGDEVEITVFNNPISNRNFAKIDRIIRRNKKQLICKVVITNNKPFFVPLDEKVQQEIIMDSDYNFKNNQVLLVRIDKYSRRTLKVSLLKIIGSLDEEFINLKIAIIDSGVKVNFDQKIIEDANALTWTESEFKKRKDFRDILTVTIDCEDTKDIDDAFSVTKENDLYKLIVHIADVSYFVKENSLVDLEGQKRGTSIYMPGQVIPMLPKKLSNDLCSLNPETEKFAISLEMFFDKNGKLKKSNIYESIIKSNFALTYNEVNDFFHKKKTFPTEQLNKMLNIAKELADILERKKNNEGYVDFEIEESKIILDEANRVKDIEIIHQGPAEKCIEIFMIAANETIAKYFSKAKLPFIYRVHQKPKDDNLENLENLLLWLGSEIKFDKEKNTPLNFLKQFNEIRKFKFDNLVKMNILRTMEKAVYSAKNDGHFGLASFAYTHFTSPIRRYPDLIVHRLVKKYFIKGHFNKIANYDEKTIAKLAKLLSASEQRGVDLERKIVDIRKSEYFKKWVGKEFEGKIISLQKFGIFVEIGKNTEGLIRTKDLPGEDYEIKNNGMVISNGQNSYSIGNLINVYISDVDVLNGKIELKVK